MASTARGSPSMNASICSRLALGLLSSAMHGWVALAAGRRQHGAYAAAAAAARLLAPHMAALLVQQRSQRRPHQLGHLPHITRLLITMMQSNAVARSIQQIHGLLDLQ
jgi:hypothetical protein